VTGNEQCDNGLDDDCDGTIDEGVEICDGVDSDCDGAIDEDLTACACAPGESGATDETCNGVDDDCDDGVDEDFDFRDDAAHCGGCGLSCASDDHCREMLCCPTASRPVDVLFVIRAGTQPLEQAFTREIGRLVERLSSGDTDGDGTPEHVRPLDLHFGVVGSSLGGGSDPTTECSEPGPGDGVLRTDPVCLPVGPRFVEHRPGDPGADDETVAAVLTCLLGTRGGRCGWEQPLEAALEALTPSTSSLRFLGSTPGKADGANAGFLRPDSILVTVVLTNRNDCSVLDADILDPMSTRYEGVVGARCFRYPEALHGVERYADGLLALRDDPRDLIFSVIAGAPPDLLTTPLDFTAILADRRMQERIVSDRLVESCGTSFFGDTSYPPVRLVRVAEQLAAGGSTPLIASSCGFEVTPLMDDIVAQVHARLDDTCAAP